MDLLEKEQSHTPCCRPLANLEADEQGLGMKYQKQLVNYGSSQLNKDFKLLLQQRGLT